MQRDILLSIIFYLCGCFYMIFGASVLAANYKNNANKLFLLLTSSLSTWSFSYSLSNSVATAEASAFWRSFSAFGWGVFSSILLHFILALIEHQYRFNKFFILVLIYLPALINIILFGPLGFFTEQQYKMVRTDFGWVNVAPFYAASVWLNLYYVLYSVPSLILLIYWWKKLKSGPALKRRQARHFIFSIILLFLIEVIIEVLPDLLGKRFFPNSAVVFMLIPTIMLYTVLRKFELLVKVEKNKYLSSESVYSPNKEQWRLFESATNVFFLGGALSFFAGYFIMNGKLEDELLEFLVLILLGILVRFAPRITKNRTVQSIILMAICVLSVLFLLKISADTGAVTVWSVYILFLLYAITLDSKIYALIFAASCIIFQIALWIRKPEVTVIIDANQYMTRIIVIGLSYFVARYLIVEYTSKLQGYRRFAREQETLEKISTNFISVNNENTDEKIDNLFELSAGILDFDQAYLVEFDADYENATFLHTHTTSETTESFPFYPGMKVKTTTLPMVKPLIAQNEPIICEDITNIYDDKEMEARNFFISRGVKSCFALPITIDKKIVEMLVVEYKTRLDANLAESRLNYLKIIANTLGDTRKKALYEERLYNIAYFDEATQLANKNMLIKRLEQKIHDNKGSEKIAVLDVELVNLRMIKDTFGQSIEEQVIINSAIIIKKLFGESCDVSRSGDGKLSILLQAAKNTEQIKTFAGKLLDSFSVPISTETGIEALFVVVYIGISVYPDDGRDAYELLKNADLAGYEARSNDEKIVFYTKHMENNVVETTLFTNKLFKSLQNEKFFLEFQPQISCETGKTVGVEALLRWDSNGGKKVLPDRFIPILEQTGLIYDVGLWVLKQALQEHNRLIKNGFPPLRFSVNLSIVQLKGGNFVLDFTKIIEESGVDPQYIELEITESFFFEDPEDTLKKLHKMKELGIHIAIDDFGSGYSSLNRLKLVPFDRIKIDKDIIDYIDLEAKAAPITELIISLAKTFNACITAEGVETKEQADFLRNVACDEIQGFYFSKPLSSEALEVFLRQEAM